MTSPMAQFAHSLQRRAEAPSASSLSVSSLPSSSSTSSFSSLSSPVSSSSSSSSSHLYRLSPLAQSNRSAVGPSPRRAAEPEHEFTVGGGFYMATPDDFDHTGLSTPKAMIAGAVAGVSEHVCMFPVDTAKTRMQSSVFAPVQQRSANVFTTLSDIARTEGPLRLYRGMGATVSAAIPAHAIYFTVVENLKEAFGGNEAGHHPIKNAAAAAIATCAHDAVGTPLDMVKQRMQVFASPYTSVTGCARDVLRKEGFRAFYASYPATVLMNIPFMAVNFATYESLKIVLTDTQGEHGVREQLIAGGGAGALGGVAATPLDVLKTRIQTDVVPEGQPRPTARAVFNQIMREEGPKGLWKGTTARVFYFMPSAAICWTSYETMKKLLMW